MKKSRKILRRIGRMTAAMILTVSAVFSKALICARAEAISEIPLSEVYFFHNAAGGYVVDDVWAVSWSRWEMHGKPAYCIEPNVFATFDDVYTAEDFQSYDGLSESTRQRLADIAHFGYGPAHSSTMDYIATQLMIWIAVNPVLSGTQVFVQEGDSHVLVSGTDITSDVQSVISRIENDISRFHTDISPEIQNCESGEYYDAQADEIEVLVGDEILISDRAGVLGDYYIKEDTCDNAEVVQEGGTVRLKFRESGSGKLVFSHREADVSSQGAVFFYRAAGTQTLMSAGAASDTQSRELRFRAVGVDLRINKASSEKLLCLANARLGLYEDSNENGIYDEGEALIEEFVTPQEEYVIHDLIPERHYVLHEIDAPNGHIRAEDIAFFPRRENAESGLSCQMVDQAFTVIVRKNTQRNDRIADVELTILDAESGETARSADGEEAVYRTMADTDWDCSRFLKEGRSYILRETELVGGVFKSADVAFTAPKAGDPALYVSVTMVDQTYQVHVRKVDNTVNASFVPEVTLHLYEVSGEEERELAEHVTDANEEYWDITAYVRAGGNYRLRETECAPGYYLSDDLDFSIPEAEKIREDDYVYEIVMVDEVHNAVYGKKDEDGSWIEGAVMLVLDEEMEERMRTMSEEEKENLVQGEDYICRFVSRKEGVRTDENGEEIRLYSGRTYYLHEEKAPFGFVPAKEDIAFTITGTLEMEQEVYMVDERKTVCLSVEKHDIEEKDKGLEGAEFTVYRRNDDSIALTAEGREAVAVTDAKGHCEFRLPYDENGYDIRETKAPAGYQRSEEKQEVLISTEDAFRAESPMVFRFYDRRVPETAARAPVMTAVITVLAAGLFLYLQKRHHG